MEEIYCDECEALVCYGDGDLNCCHFLCVPCIQKIFTIDPKHLNQALAAQWKKLPSD